MKKLNDVDGETRVALKRKHRSKNFLASTELNYTNFGQKRNFLLMNGLFLSFACFLLILSLYFNGNISFYQQKINRIPTTVGWNVFLALVAYDAAYFLQIVQKKGLIILLSLLWLGFYPNTFYMITDASHFADWLSIAGKFNLPLEVSGKQLAYFGILFVGIFMGVILGIWSTLLVIERFFKKIIWTGLFILILSFLSSVAIFTGKSVTLRLNTWNLLTNPLSTVQLLFDAIKLQHMTFLLGFTAMQCFLIAFYWLGKNGGKN